MRKLIVRTALAGAILGFACGCTSSADAPAGSSPPSTGDPSSGRSAASSSPAAELPTGEIQQPPNLAAGWQGIVKDVTIESCPTDPGPVTAAGTVVNSAGESRDISIAIAWNAPDSTRSLMQLTVTETNVPAGETVSWDASGDLPAKAGQCVVLARSGTLTDR